MGVTFIQLRTSGALQPHKLLFDTHPKCPFTHQKSEEPFETDAPRVLYILNVDVNPLSHGTTVHFAFLILSLPLGSLLVFTEATIGGPTSRELTVGSTLHGYSRGQNKAGEKPRISNETGRNQG